MGKIHQFHTAVAASYGMLLCGILFVWPSYTASLYTDEKTTLLSAPMTHVDISLIGSLPSLGAMLGTLLTGKITNVFGRHRGGLILMLPFLLSWILVDLTKSAIVVMTARFVGGVASGGYLAYGPIFISEVAENSIRGFLASGPITFFCLGTLTSYLLGWFLSYQYVLWVNMGLCCVGLINLMTVTESPVWLVRQRREAEARLAFAHYKGVSPDSKIVLEEISKLRAQVIPAVELNSVNDANIIIDKAEKEKLKLNEQTAEEKKRLSAFKMIFSSPSTRRAFIVTGLALCLQVLMGMVLVQVYAKEIFVKAVPSLSPHLCSVLLATTLLGGTVTSAVFTDRFGRRTLLIISATIVFLCLISMGTLLQTNILPPWVTAVLIFICCYSFKFGSGNVPYILLAEVFIPEVRSTATMILVECVWLMSFLQLGTFPFIIRYFGVHGAFYCFSLFAVLEALVGIFLLPETKGLTNEQIQEAFLRKWKIKSEIYT